MTAFGTDGGIGEAGRGRDRPAGDGDEDQRRILFKDNRRIDPDTGRARAQGEAAPTTSEPPADETAAESGAPLSDADRITVEAAQQEAAERTADLQRLTAEYANYRKRVDRDKQAATATGKAAVAGELLAVLDDLDRAEEHGDLTGGFKNVADKLVSTLTSLGLEHYGAEGDEFDPNVHEAVQFATSSEVSEPTVTTVLRLGYRFDERVLRPAVVMVTGPEEASVSATDDASAETDSAAGTSDE